MQVVEPSYWAGSIHKCCGLPPSTKFSWQNAWMDEDIEDFQKSSILASSFRGELTREG
jgi:hypothetical protein